MPKRSIQGIVPTNCICDELKDRSGYRAGWSPAAPPAHPISDTTRAKRDFGPTVVAEGEQEDTEQAIGIQIARAEQAGTKHHRGDDSLT
jgi:hypothetical protein